MTNQDTNSRRVFWGCFLALATCAFGFIVRTQVIGDWQTQFNLSETEKGSILGVGFWPFAFSIFIFSLVIDKFGYGRAAVVGLVLHLASVLVLLSASSANMLYWGTFLFALSNGTVEAYINPTIASMYPKEKSKWLNILHAGWPGGMVLAGILAISLGDIDWRWKISLILLPTSIYSLILLGTRFPVSERVAAGVTFREAAKDFGALGAFAAVYLIALQVCEGILQLDSGSFLWPLLPATLAASAFGFYVGSIGRIVYFLLLLIMIPLATTELGIDSWITDLMAPEMTLVGLHAGWVLVYTSAIMMVLRFFAGPILNRIKPLELLAFCAVIAIIGLFTLSKAAGLGILLAATVYGVGKSFFWPTMLGVVSEQFPKGGALTLNCVGGVGMLGLSVGMVFLGNIQDHRIESDMQAYDKATSGALYQTYMTEEKRSVFGGYKAIDQNKLDNAPVEDLEQIAIMQTTAKKNALSTAAFFPVVMLIAFIGLILFYRSRGGYKPNDIRRN